MSISNEGTNPTNARSGASSDDSGRGRCHWDCYDRAGCCPQTTPVQIQFVQFYKLYEQVRDQPGTCEYKIVHSLVFSDDYMIGFFK